MSVVDGGNSSGLVQRVQDILLKPKPTWAAIDAEPATVGGLYTGYAIPLAAIPAVCGAIGGALFGFGGFGFAIHPPLTSLIVSAVAQYALSLGMLFVMALIVDALAPSFGGTKSQIQALKLAVYSSTGSWVAGVFLLIPSIGGLIALLGALYSLFLLFKGLPVLMKTAEDKALPYTAVVIVVAIVAALIVGAITAPLRGMAAFGMAGRNNVEVNLPGNVSIDVGKIEDASKRLEADLAKARAGEGLEPTNPTVLQGYLPDSIAGYSRTDVTASSGGAGGFNGSNAEGVYAKGDATITVTIVDLGSAGAIASMANALNLSQSHQGDGRYEKVGKVDGRMTTESYDTGSKHGEYLVVVGERFTVGAEGSGASMDELKAAVGAVGPARLEALAKAG